MTLHLMRGDGTFIVRNGVSVEIRAAEGTALFSCYMHRALLALDLAADRLGEQLLDLCNDHEQCSRGEPMRPPLPVQRHEAFGSL